MWVLRMMISSANANALAHKFPIKQPFSEFSKCLNDGSKYNEKSKGLMAHPCLTPLFKGNSFNSVLFHLAHAQLSEYMLIKSLTIRRHIFLSSITSNNLLYFTLSNFLEASNKRAYPFETRER